MSIAFLGLGGMGAAMAMNLVKAGREVTVWNRSADKADALKEAGAEVAATPAEAAANADIVFSMLADDKALLAVLAGEDGVLHGLPERALHVSMSTIAVATADAVAARHNEHDQRYVSAPVFGRPDAAAAAKLFVIAAGAKNDLDEANPYFELMGQKIFRVGEAPSLANLVKLCGNFAFLAAIEAMAEAMVLAEKGGVPRATLHEVFTGTLLDAPIYQNYGKMIVDEKYTPPGFAAPLALKDMRLVGESADKNRVPMPLLSLLRDRLSETIAKEGDEIDWAGIARTIAKNAGL